VGGPRGKALELKHQLVSRMKIVQQVEVQFFKSKRKGSSDISVGILSSFGICMGRWECLIHESDPDTKMARGR
jgi:hypothetical protein